MREVAVIAERMQGEVGEQTDREGEEPKAGESGHAATLPHYSINCQWFL